MKPLAVLSMLLALAIFGCDSGYEAAPAVDVEVHDTPDLNPATDDDIDIDVNTPGDVDDVEVDTADGVDVDAPGVDVDAGGGDGVSVDVNTDEN